MKRHDHEAARAVSVPLAEITDLRVEAGGRAIVDGLSSCGCCPAG